MAAIDPVGTQAERNRIWRSREARGVRDALLAQCERGLLSHFRAGKLRLGRMTFTLCGIAGRDCRLLLDVEAGTLQLLDLLPRMNESPSAFRELRSFLCLSAGARSPPSLLRVDPDKGEVELEFMRAGMALTALVKDSEYEHCAARLVALAAEILRAFAHYDVRVMELSGPQSERTENMYA